MLPQRNIAHSTCHIHRDKATKSNPKELKDCLKALGCPGAKSYLNFSKAKLGDFRMGNTEKTTTRNVCSTFVGGEIKMKGYTKSTV